jgi:hypothetical protein
LAVEGLLALAFGFSVFLALVGDGAAGLDFVCGLLATVFALVATADWSRATTSEPARAKRPATTSDVVAVRCLRAMGHSRHAVLESSRRFGITYSVDRIDES